MGSPLFPIVADLVLQKLEFNVISKLSMESIFYYRFVDDIALAAASFCLNDLLHSFSSFHPRLCFTIKIEDNILNFLTIIKRDYDKFYMIRYNIHDFTNQR